MREITFAAWLWPACLVVFVVRFLEVVQKNVERSDDCSLKDCGRRPQIQSRQNRHLIGG